MVWILWADSVKSVQVSDGVPGSQKRPSDSPHRVNRWLWVPQHGAKNLTQVLWKSSILFIAHFLYTFLGWWVSRLLFFPRHYEYHSKEQGGTNISVVSYRFHWGYTRYAVTGLCHISISSFLSYFLTDFHIRFYQLILFPKCIKIFLSSQHGRFVVINGGKMSFKLVSVFISLMGKDVRLLKNKIFHSHFYFFFFWELCLLSRASFCFLFCLLSWFFKFFYLLDNYFLPDISLFNTTPPFLQITWIIMSFTL